MMQREASSSSISSEDGDRSDVPTTSVTKASSPGKYDIAKSPRDWLSPPASPNPGLNPFFDEGEMKKTQMVREFLFQERQPLQADVGTIIEPLLYRQILRVGHGK